MASTVVYSELRPAKGWFGTRKCCRQEGKRLRPLGGPLSSSASFGFLGLLTLLLTPPSAG